MGDEILKLLGLSKQPIVREVIKEVPIPRKKYHFSKEEEDEIIELVMEYVSHTWGAWSKSNKQTIEMIVRGGLEIGRNK